MRNYGSPLVEAYLTELGEDVDKIVHDIKQKEAELSAAIAANDLIDQMHSRNSAAERVRGRISMFLESFLPEEGLSNLKADNRRLNNKVKQLEEQIGANDSNERFR